MKKRVLIGILAVLATLSSAAWRPGSSSIEAAPYGALYGQRLAALHNAQERLLDAIGTGAAIRDEAAVRAGIRAARAEMKAADFWLRYLEPLAYKKVNGPLPVEWETEVFEKWEKPYRREGAGLTLAWNYLEEEGATADSLRSLVLLSQRALEAYAADSITSQIPSCHVFYLCNRLYLLNLSAIYTTGFECPDGKSVIPELLGMMRSVDGIYTAFGKQFPKQALSTEYREQYRAALAFVAAQPSEFEAFDHFTFLRDYVNALYGLNTAQMQEHSVVTRSLVDYSLNDAPTIFDKNLYTGQSTKGIFRRVKDAEALAELDRVGKLLFYDPILSGNNQRSCASCHKPTQFFTDTTVRTPAHFNGAEILPRNTPSLIGALHNHLVMADGGHLSLQNQSTAVIINAVEMSGTDAATVLQKIMSCGEYKTAFQKLLKYTPQEPEVTMEHVASAITFYYTKFSGYYAPFDDAMDRGKTLEPAAVAGFNLFMGKAQCATCHFVPGFNGVKPPYIGSEFEVLGTPADTAYDALSPDKGRWEINPAYETLGAFRTGTVRNAARTAPYMHNGVFRTMDQLLEFYNGGGGAGRGLHVPNQTLAADSLHLTTAEKAQLTAFISSLTERVVPEAPPTRLPRSSNKAFNSRRVGGEY